VIAIGRSGAEAVEGAFGSRVDRPTVRSAAAARDRRDDNDRTSDGRPAAADERSAR
jgi:hypothetical protein